VLDVMAECSLMEGTGEVRLIPNRQLVRHPRRRSSLDEILLEQDGGVAPHMSLGLGQTASLEPVVEVVVDVGVRAFVGTAADFVKLPVKPPRYSISLTRPGALLSLRECSWIPGSNWYVLLLFARVFGRGQSDHFRNGLTFYGNNKICETRI